MYFTLHVDKNIIPVGIDFCAFFLFFSLVHVLKSGDGRGICHVSHFDAGAYAYRGHWGNHATQIHMVRAKAAQRLIYSQIVISKYNAEQAGFIFRLPAFFASNTAGQISFTQTQANNNRHLAYFISFERSSICLFMDNHQTRPQGIRYKYTICREREKWKKIICITNIAAPLMSLSR